MFFKISIKLEQQTHKMAYQFEMVFALAQRGDLWGPLLPRDIRMLREIQEQDRIQATSTWVLLRDSTRTNILNGRITQLDSAAITAVTLSNNIPRRSMEFVATELMPTPPNPYQVGFDDFDDDAWHEDDGNDDENNYNNYEEDDEHHYEDDNRHYHYLEDDRTYYGGYYTDI